MYGVLLLTLRACCAPPTPTPTPPHPPQATVVKVVAAPGGTRLAHLRLTDLKQTLSLPLEAVLPHLPPRPPRAPRAPAAPAAPAAAPRKKARPRPPAPGAPPRQGPALDAALRALCAAPDHPDFPPGTRLWVGVSGGWRWPAVAWAPRLAGRRELGELLLARRGGGGGGRGGAGGSSRGDAGGGGGGGGSSGGGASGGAASADAPPGPVPLLVRFYGEHSMMWVAAGACARPPPDQAPLLRQLAAWGRATHQ
jgi:hypothetical protein